MWANRLVFAGVVVLVLFMAAMAVLIAMTGGVFLLQEL
jgi:hypothetical protein